MSIVSEISYLISYLIWPTWNCELCTFNICPRVIEWPHREICRVATCRLPLTKILYLICAKSQELYPKWTLSSCNGRLTSALEPREVATFAFSIRLQSGFCKKNICMGITWGTSRASRAVESWTSNTLLKEIFVEEHGNR